MAKSDRSIESVLRVAALLLGALLIVAACGKSEEKKAATQVAAKVNSDEISVHQINAVLAKTPGIPQEMAGKARMEILDKLIEQQLAVQQAVDKKLDRTPEVMTAIESARREILARAYVEQVLNGLPKPTDDDAQKYFAAHPELFSQRRIYKLQEIAVSPANAPVAQLRDMVAGRKSMEDIVAALKQQNIQFAPNAATQPAEQIPMELLAKLYVLKDGQATVVETPKAVYVMRVVASQAAPVEEAAALPRIRQFLANQQGGEAARREMAQLKEKAKIEYMGEFAAGPVAKPAAPPPAAKVEPPPAAPAPRVSSTKADSAKPVVSDATVEKGVAGLK